MAREKKFRFKQFEVLNDRTAMKVGTDGVLLGAWCPVEGMTRVLDVGTGCGVITLMVAQRNNGALIESIDVDEGAIDEAKLNFAASPWSERLTARLQDFNVLEVDPTSPTAYCPPAMPAPRHGTPNHSPTANSSTEPQGYSPTKAYLPLSLPPMPRALLSRLRPLPLCPSDAAHAWCLSKEPKPSAPCGCCRAAKCPTSKIP